MAISQIILLCFVIHILLLFSLSLETTTSQRREGRALVKWKNTLGSDSDDVLRSWSIANLDNICTNWTGIGCDYGGAVYKIELDSFGLSGTLETLDFNSFPNLTHFNLHDNNFRGSIPNAIVNLTQLVFLDLGENYLVGTIPIQISHLHHLTSLYLNGNYFTGPILESLFSNHTNFKSEANLSQLVFLDLSWNLFEGFIPSGIGRFTKLQLLNLRVNYFAGIIPSQISQLQQLTSISLNENIFTEGRFPEELFSNMTKLQIFSCGWNLFHGPFPKSLIKLSKLTLLDLSENYFYGSIPPTIGNLTLLEAFSVLGTLLHGNIPTTRGEQKNRTDRKTDDRKPNRPNISVFGRFSVIKVKYNLLLILSRIVPQLEEQIQITLFFLLCLFISIFFFLRIFISIFQIKENEHWAIRASTTIPTLHFLQSLKPVLSSSQSPFNFKKTPLRKADYPDSKAVRFHAEQHLILIPLIISSVRHCSKPAATYAPRDSLRFRLRRRRTSNLIVEMSRRIVRVAQDGSGDYRTVQEAIDSVPLRNASRTVITVAPGVYRQPVYVPKTKNLITFAGLRPEDTVLSWNNTATKIDHHQTPRVIGTGTFGCGSTIVEGEDFIAENITFENSAPQGSGQAVAIRVTADRCAFYNCRFLGWQDTLYLHYGKQYLKDCYIEGSVDFIFGNSTALLEHCHVHCKSAGFITAQSRKSPQETTGYVFLRCVITGNGGTSYTHLGRTWGPFGRVVFAYTYMDACIKQDGWNNWGKTENEKTACFFEYRCYGPGSCPEKRVTWTRELVSQEAEQFLMHGFIDPDPQRPWLAQRMALRIPYSA